MPHVSRFTFYTVVGVVLLLACGCRPSSYSASSPSTIEYLIENYKTWPKATSRPRNVSLMLWSLCRVWTQVAATIEAPFHESEHGNLFLQVYVNPIGEEAMLQTEIPIFPPGSIIVKEKLLNGDDTEPVALGIMIKHEAGFNPAGGDWEYVYWTADSVTQGEALTHCQECHLGQTETDSVFRPYVTFEHSE